LAQEGSAYDLNINMFNVFAAHHNRMAGGKPNTDDTSTELTSTQSDPFSPHPDDDVGFDGRYFSKIDK
jgi:glucosamine-6-phosphate deaminase